MYIAEVSEESEGRVIEKLSQEFSRTEFRILSALSKLDEYLLDPRIRTFSGTVPKTFRNADSEKQQPREDRCQNDPHPEVNFYACCASNVTNADPEETFHMVTGVQEKIHYCSLRTSSGKQKKVPSTSQPQFRSDNTPATIESDHILLALQQLQVTVILPISTATITEYQFCPNPSRRQCLYLTGNQKQNALFEDLFQTYPNFLKPTHRKRQNTPFPLSHAW